MIDPRPRSEPQRTTLTVIVATLVAAAALGALVGVEGVTRLSAPAPPEVVAAVRGVAEAALPDALRDALPAPAPAGEERRTEPRPRRLAVLTVQLGRNQTLAQVLSRLPLAPGQAHAILEALRDKFPFHRARPGDQIRVEREEGDNAFRRFTYRQSAADEWTVVPDAGGALRGEKRPVELTTEVTRVDVEIRGSVWETLQRYDEEPALAVIAADVLAWDVDFYQDVRPGDHLKVLVEKIFADGKLLRYGNVLGAEYDGRVTGRKRLFRYTDPDGHASYYDDEGRSAHRGFLRAPLRFALLSSGYGKRVHPVLGFVKAHQGVDYRAPTGTPVWAVGDGTVVQAGWNGSCGKSVTVSHRNGLDTVYCHLSAVSVRPGERVAQKQLIGAVGRTGRATGPHLHYAVKRGDAFLNPFLLTKIPPDAPVPPQLREDFERKIAPLRASLDAKPVA